MPENGGNSSGTIMIVAVVGVICSCLLMSSVGGYVYKDDISNLFDSSGGGESERDLPYYPPPSTGDTTKSPEEEDSGDDCRIDTTNYKACNDYINKKIQTSQEFKTDDAKVCKGCPSRWASRQANEYVMNKMVDGKQCDKEVYGGTKDDRLGWLSLNDNDCGTRGSLKFASATTRAGCRAEIKRWLSGTNWKTDPDKDGKWGKMWEDNGLKQACEPCIKLGFQDVWKMQHVANRAGDKDGKADVYRTDPATGEYEHRIDTNKIDMNYDTIADWFVRGMPDRCKVSAAAAAGGTRRRAVAAAGGQRVAAAAGAGQRATAVRKQSAAAKPRVTKPKAAAAAVRPQKTAVAQRKR